MRRFWLIIILFASFNGLRGQISTDQFEFRFGYNLHNSYATRFNHLIETFNNDRYPFVISENLNSVNFLRGFNFGVNYKFRDDMSLHAVFKNQHQFLNTAYVGYNNLQLQYLFRQNTMELGITFSVGDMEHKFIRQNVSGGLVLGYMSVYSDWSQESKYKGTGEMQNISHSAVLGLAGSYEVQFSLSKEIKLYLRPVAMFNLPSFIRNLNAFMNPQVVDGNVSYTATEPEKYNSGSLSGLGIEGGLLISLPDFR